MLAWAYSICRCLYRSSSSLKRSVMLCPRYLVLSQTVRIEYWKREVLDHNDTNTAYVLFNLFKLWQTIWTVDISHWCEVFPCNGTFPSFALLCFPYLPRFYFWSCFHCCADTLFNQSNHTIFSIPPLEKPLLNYNWSCFGLLRLLKSSHLFES